MSSHITALFKTQQAAENAIRKIEDIGVSDEQLGLIVTDETEGNTFNIEKGTKMDEGAAGGATAGGIIGGVLGSLGTATAMALPGVNVIVSGIWVSALAGVGAGATVGGLAGALGGAGVSEHEAKILEDEVKSGAILLSVEPANDDQKDQIKDILEREDAYKLAS